MDYSKYSVVLEYLGIFDFNNVFEAVKLRTNDEPLICMWSLN